MPKRCEHKTVGWFIENMGKQENFKEYEIKFCVDCEEELERTPLTNKDYGLTPSMVLRIMKKKGVSEK